MTKLEPTEWSKEKGRREVWKTAFEPLGHIYIKGYPRYIQAIVRAEHFRDIHDLIIFRPLFRETRHRQIIESLVAKGIETRGRFILKEVFVLLIKVEKLLQRIVHDPNQMLRDSSAASSSLIQS